MPIEKGSVVRSKAGHDSNRFYLVMSVEGDFAYIADGAVRKLEHPKKKRMKHLAPTNTVLSVEELTTNKLVKEALTQFNAERQSL